MSKIQDALKRIQGEAATASQPDTSGKRLARVDDTIAVRHLAESEVPESFRHAQNRYGGKAVVVNRDELERAGFLVSGETQHRLADECRAIKRPIIANAQDAEALNSRRPNLVMVASSLPGEGKTFSCINLALSIAREKDWSVVLVDADSSRQHLTSLFAAEGEHGLLDILKNKEVDPNDLIMPSDVDSLSILPAGQRDELAVELFSSNRMAKIAEQWSKEDPKRVFIFDSSPVLLTPEPAVLSTVVGQVVFIVQAGHTSHADIQSAVEKLDGECAINAVLNQVEYGRRAGGSDYYGYYNSAGPQSPADE